MIDKEKEGLNLQVGEYTWLDVANDNDYIHFDINEVYHVYEDGDLNTNEYIASILNIIASKHFICHPSN